MREMKKKLSYRDINENKLSKIIIKLTAFYLWFACVEKGDILVQFERPKMHTPVRGALYKFFLHHNNSGE